MSETPKPALRPGMRYCPAETESGWALWTPDLGSRRWPTWGDWCEARRVALPEGVHPSWTRCWPTRDAALVAVGELRGTVSCDRGW